MALGERVVWVTTAAPAGQRVDHALTCRMLAAAVGPAGAEAVAVCGERFWAAPAIATPGRQCLLCARRAPMRMTTREHGVPGQPAAARTAANTVRSPAASPPGTLNSAPGVAEVSSWRGFDVDSVRSALLPRLGAPPCPTGNPPSQPARCGGDQSRHLHAVPRGLVTTPRRHQGSVDVPTATEEHHPTCRRHTDHGNATVRAEMRHAGHEHCYHDSARSTAAERRWPTPLAKGGRS